MNRNSHNLKGSSVNPVPRWGIVFIALVVVFTIGSAGPTLTVQAAPAGATELRFFMIALKEGAASTHVCVGELVTLQVLVYRYKVIDGVSESPDTVTGVTVEGWSHNPNIGQISPRRNTTIVASSIYPGAADFLFTAENPGETTITFVGTVATGWLGTNFRGNPKTVTADVDVRVIPCKFKVTTIGQWHVPGPANLSVMAISDDAEVKAVDAQSPFTGSTSVNLVLSTGRVGDCIPQSVTASSQLNWTGQMDDNGGLTLNGIYQSAAMSLPVFCVGSDGGIASGSTPAQMTPDPLQVSVASSGGVFRQSQVLQGPEATPGYVTIIVAPQEDEASAFNIDSRAALAPFEWWARLWDNFPWLYNPVLAFR